MKPIHVKKIYLLGAIALLTACSLKESPKNDLYNFGLKGHVKEITTNTYGASIKFGEPTKEDLKESYVSKFNEDGNESGETNTLIFYDGSKHIINFVFYYNDQNKLISMAHGKNEKPFVYLKYNSSGLLVEKDYFNKDNLDSKEKFTYNDKHLMSIEDNYDAKGILKGKIKLVYDDNRSVREILDYDSLGSLDYKDAFKYNDNRMVISKDVFMDNKIYKHTYSYSNEDAKGNWQKQIDFVKGNPDEIIERKIVYY